MSITSLYFPLFLIFLFIVYFAAPKKYQWVILLVFSAAFDVLVCGAWGYGFLLLTASSVYAAARVLSRMHEKHKAALKEKKDTLTREEKALLKKRQLKAKRLVLIVTLFLNFGVLCAFKYSNFLLSLVSLPPLFRWAAPLGISFYTFQATGYLVDVYWENVSAERNFARFLLFVSFFPQITQGPISEFDQLSKELTTPHDFSYDRFSRGFQRLLWGFAKKMVLANLLSPFVSAAFSGYKELSALTVLSGAFGYSVQIYADFSGYMDIMCGACEMLGITLTENFDRPYFSKSIAEYWRRWHITLGAWFKKYVYYPIAVSKWNQKLGKTARAHLPKSVAGALPASMALVAVWFLTGLWHGASLKYLAWGGVNGLFIILSLWLEPVYEKTRNALHVEKYPFIFRAFRVIRTFFLVTLIKVLPEVGTLSDGLGFVGRIFRAPVLPASLSRLIPNGIAISSLLICLIFTLVLFLVSLLSRKKDTRERFSRLPVFVRVLLLSILFIIILTCGAPAARNAGGFMYAQF